MKLKQAEAKLAVINSADPVWFCPLINTKCRIDCVNFQKAHILGPERNLSDVDADEFDVVGYMCSNTQFTGVPLIVRCVECDAVLSIGIGPSLED